MADDKVIQAFPARDLPENPVEVERRQGYCRHPAIRLVEHDRQVVCAKCDATLDPFNYLLGEASAIRSAWDDHRMVRHKVDQLRESIRALEKERARLAGAVRRLKAKEEAAIDFRKPL